MRGAALTSAGTGMAHGVGIAQAPGARLSAVVSLALLAAFATAQAAGGENRAGLLRKTVRDAEAAENLRRLGDAAQARGDFAEALRSYRRARELDPSDVPTLLRMIQLLKIAGQHAEAEALARDGLSRAPDSAELHYEIGHLDLQRGNLADSERSLRRAIALDPLFWQARHDLARLLYGTGREEEARREERATRALREYGDREKVLLERLEALAGDGRAAVCLAEIELSHRRFRTALSHFARAQALGAEEDRIAAGRAEALFGIGDARAGEAALARAAAGSEAPRFALARAWALLAAGEDPLPALAPAIPADPGAQPGPAGSSGAGGDRPGQPVEFDVLLRAAELARRASRPDLADFFLARAARAVPSSSCGRLVASAAAL